MHGANGGGAFRQAVPRGIGVSILASDLAFSYMALESPFLLAIWPCMELGASQSGALLCPRVAGLHGEEDAIEDCDFAMHGASHSGAF